MNSFQFFFVCFFDRYGALRDQTKCSWIRPRTDSFTEETATSSFTSTNTEDVGDTSSTRGESFCSGCRYAVAVFSVILPKRVLDSLC